MLHRPAEDDHDSDLELTGIPTDSPDQDDDCLPLDDAQEQIGYELHEWEPATLDELDDVLHSLALPHEWVSDGYEVVIHEADEAQMDRLIAQLGPQADAVDPSEDWDDELDELGEDAVDVEQLSDLFVAADRMHADPDSAVGGFLDAAERLGSDPPFGVDADHWRLITDELDAVLDALHAGAPAGAVSDAALRLRQRLRPLV